MSIGARGVTRLAYVRFALATETLEPTRVFYRDVLGLVVSGAADARRLLFRCWHEAMPYSLVIDRAERSGLVEIGFEVASPAELDRLTRRLRESGFETAESAPDAVLPGLGVSVAVRPGGVPLRLHASMTREQAYLMGNVSPDWVVPRELRACPAPLFLNHVGLTVTDPAQTAEILGETLGFVVSERIDAADGGLVSALLFRCAKDVGGQEIALFKGPAGGLHHIAFTKEDPTDILVDAQYLRCARVKLDPMGPTRQSYGKTFSLYFHDVNGVRLELCTGGRFIEPHPELEPVVWTESHLRKALSFYDEEISADFLVPCL